MSLQRVGSLEVDQDLEYNRWWWRFQHVARIGIGVLLAITATGAFGHGALASGRAGQPGSDLWVEYERIMRHDSASVMRVHMRPPPAADRTATLWVANDLFERLQVVRIVPEPDSHGAASDRVFMHFKAAEPRDPIVVTFEIQSDGYGPLDFHIGMPGGPELAFGAFIMP